MSISMLGVLVLASSSPPLGNPSPSDRVCGAALRRAIARAETGVVAERCWRAGPITLGSSAHEVEQRLGAPVAVGAWTVGTQPRRDFRATLYAFPATPGPLVRAGRVRLRLVQLRFEANRLVAIDNEPSARTDAARCAASRRPPVDELQIGAAAGPILSFAGVAVGDPLAALRRQLGRTPDCNRSRDWCSYLPVPVSFGVDDDRRVIRGFAIATDYEALAGGGMPRLHLNRDAATCKITSVRFSFAHD